MRGVRKKKRTKVVVAAIVVGDSRNAMLENQAQTRKQKKKWQKEADAGEKDRDHSTSSKHAVCSLEIIRLLSQKLLFSSSGQ